MCQCHRFASSGGGAGPDLSEIGGKRSSRELLESIVQPSQKIATGFATTVVVTADGRAIEGRVTYEGDQNLILQPSDPLATPITLSSEEIDEKHASNKSTMPEDLINTLQKSELLDSLGLRNFRRKLKASCFCKIEMPHKYRRGRREVTLTATSPLPRNTFCPVSASDVSAEERTMQLESVNNRWGDVRILARNHTRSVSKATSRHSSAHNFVLQNVFHIGGLLTSLTC